MKNRWLNLMYRLNISDTDSEMFLFLKDSYESPKRFYHTLDHISSCLKELDPVKPLLKDPDLVELAIWFHDFWYISKNNDNEERSAKAAGEFLLVKGKSLDVAEKVKLMILATKHDGRSLSDSDCQNLVDIDLSVFGKDIVTFNEYEKGIRKEYSFVPWNVYQEKRIEILRNFLKRSRIFSTNFFFDKYENRARQNLTELIKTLMTSSS